MEAMPHEPILAPIIPLQCMYTNFSRLMYNVVTLVRVVKSMQKLGCKSFVEEPDVEIVGRWLQYNIVHYEPYLGGEGFESELCHSFTIKQSTILVGYIAI